MSNGEYTVNYDQLLKDEEVPEIVKSLARGLRVNPYMRIGDYLQSLNYDRFDELMEVIEHDDEDYRLENTMLMCMLLADAEGVYLETESDLARACSMFPMFVAITSLQRKGMIRAYYDNMSFGEDAMNLTLAEKI